MNASSHTQRPGDLTSDELEWFLEVLVGRETTGFLELRSRRRDYPARLRQHWYSVREIRGAARAIRRLGGRTDVYVGVAPRRTRHGGKAAISRTWVLWADLDQPAPHDRLARVPVAPGISVRSGSSGHRHLYWPLTDAVSAKEAEHANRVLAHAIGADAGAVVNAATILRPPGTLNHKREPATVVQLERFDPCPHPLAAILAGLPNQPRRDAMSAPRRTGGDPLLGIEPAVYVEVLTGQRVPDERKISCPFHADRTPSLHVYPTPERGWVCYGCGRGGTIYDLAAALWLPGYARGTPLRGRAFLAVRQRLLATFAQVAASA